MPNPEPRFSRIAAAIADPSRARMLGALLGGEHRSAGELAASAGITPQAASTQLAHLVDAALVAVRQQGRHKYFALADGDVAHALEALALIAERDTVSTRCERPAYKPLKCARRCYGHMAGQLGVAQFEMLLRCGHLRPSEIGLPTDKCRQHVAGGSRHHCAHQNQHPPGLPLHGLVRAQRPLGGYAGQGAAGPLPANGLATGRC